MGRPQKMKTRMCTHKKSPIILALVFFQLFASYVCSVQSEIYNNTNQKLRPRDELKKLRHAREYLKKINKQSVKTIQSPNGDFIDCVLSHLQPAFDHPRLKGQRPMNPPDMPNWGTETFEESFQVWTKSGESCPENTVPIKRTTEQDVLRASSVRSFGRKTVRRDSNSEGHEHAIGYVDSEQYYGASAIINVWAPHVQELGEFSISQIWVTAESPTGLNTIEVGWQVEPDIYGDGQPRLFAYWTSDGYQETGCYNLLCSGFVQIPSNVALGAAISPVSTYAGQQYDIQMSVYKDPKVNGDWWLAINGKFIGYWPSSLFTKSLEEHANMIEFGGEIVNTGSGGHHHTSTQMGSGYFPGEFYGRASYFRKLQVINSVEAVVEDVSNLQLQVDKEYCYNIQIDDTTYTDWGTYFFYGGPGRNAGCP